MIAYLEGRIQEKTESSCILVTRAGVGYEVHVPAHTLAALPARGEETALFTLFIAREDAQELFGFSTWDERQTFAMLITINRVGARTALAILSQFRPGDLRRVVAEDDVAALTHVSGIGKQTAQKIFLELKYKFKSDGPAVLPAEVSGNAVLRDVLAGLANLGYEDAAVAAIVRQTLEQEPDLDVSGALRAALKAIGKKK